MYRTLVIVCLFLGFAHSMFDKCHRGIKSRGKKNVTLSPDCTKGELYWNYPSGTLQVNILEEDGRPFTMCVGYVNDRYVRRVRYTTATETKIFKLPIKRDKTVCFQSNGGMSLAFIGPKRMKTYMAFIRYTIKQKMDYSEFKMDLSKLT